MHADRALRSLLLTLACLALTVPASATAGGTVSSDGTRVVFGGSGESDNLAVEYDIPPVNGVSVPSYVFGGRPTTKTLDGSVNAGANCKALRQYVACPANAIQHIDVFMIGGDDVVTVGGGKQMPASISVFGGLGDDRVFADEAAPSGKTILEGDLGNDTLTTFSNDVPVRMSGSTGNDTFVWDKTNHGIATYANGGPGDDVFNAVSALGPDTIVTGTGSDSVDVRNSSPGDQDVVTCSRAGLARLSADANDLTGGCILDVFARSAPALRASLRHVSRKTFRHAPAIRLAGLQVPRPGVVTATLRRKGRTAATATVVVRRAGRVLLAIPVSGRGHTLLRSPRGIQLVVGYRPADGGRPRQLVVKR